MSIASDVGLVIPTLNAGHDWLTCIQAVRRQTMVPRRILSIDSESSDETANVARAAGFEVVVIARSQFNHGGTRQWAVDYLSDCRILIFLTQDAILASNRDIEKIIQCFEDPAVAVAYGRQVPHAGATAIEAHARLYNYGDHTIKKDAAAVQRLGTKVFFCSNSFAAYRRSILIALGGFRRDLILGEDMEFAARAIKEGYTNMYCAEATVHHSHDYSFKQSFARYFDIGAFDADNAWMRTEFGSHRGQGIRFVRSELKYLARNARLNIPRSICLTAAKLLGYRIGRLHRFLSRPVKRKLSMFPAFWR